MAEPAAAVPGDALAFPLNPNQFNDLTEIGRGVASMVFMVTFQGNMLAMKVIDPSKMPESFGSGGGGMEDAVLEHENLLVAHGRFTAGGRIWIAMPLMNGGSIQSVMEAAFPAGLPERALSAVLLEAVKALAYLESRGIVHGALKPGNLLIASDGGVKLSDLGTSAAAYLPISDLPDAPFWVAPEGEPDDIWSLGITALELAFGKAPAPPALPERYRAGETQSTGKREMPAAFVDFVRSCLTADRSRRPRAADLVSHGYLVADRAAVADLLLQAPPLTGRFNPAISVLPPAPGPGRHSITAWNFNERSMSLEPTFSILPPIPEPVPLPAATDEDTSPEATSEAESPIVCCKYFAVESERDRNMAYATFLLTPAVFLMFLGVFGTCVVVALVLVGHAIYRRFCASWFS